jgi:hypothetical protein
MWNFHVRGYDFVCMAIRHQRFKGSCMCFSYIGQTGCFRKCGCVERLTQIFCTLPRIRITDLTFTRSKIADVRITVFWGMTPCSLVDKCQLLGEFKSVKPPRSPWPARELLLLLILSNVKVSTKFYIVNNIVPVILFACRTQRDLSELCLCFSPPNQEKDTTLFLRICCFFSCRWRG